MAHHQDVLYIHHVSYSPLRLYMALGGKLYGDFLMNRELLAP